VGAIPPRAPHVLLTRHFLRQFLENDLVSPDGDRSQTLAVVTATIVSLTLFLGFAMSAEYLGPLLTPGLVAVRSLDDKFFYLALGMIATALVAASQWDALAIDARDAAILEPLPVPTTTIRRAKLSAVAILGTAAAIAVNVCPSVVFPLLLVYTIRDVTLLQLLGLMAAHAVMTIAASGFGYLVIVALRETMVAVLGWRWFTRVSPWTQGLLIVFLGGSLLLLPPAADRIAERGFDGWKANSPPMWFLGAYEGLAGGVIVDQPRRWMPPRVAGWDQTASARYQARRSEFPGLARRAALAVGLTLLIAAVAYLVNAHRVSSLSLAPAARSRRRWRLLGALAHRVLIRRPAARAGFHFALAAMWRSTSHRLTLACAAAVGFAMAVLALSNASVGQGEVTPRLLAVQPLLYGALLAGFRHAIRVPAELRANWGFQLAWRDERRAFVGGVKAAAVIALVLPSLVVVLPLFMFVLGLERALVHAALGLAGAIVLLEALMLGYEKVPFTCTYLPFEKIKALAPVYVIAFVVGASVFARLQHAALVGTGAVTILAILAVAFAALRVIALTRARLPEVQFEEAPVTIQRLGLDG
jgi:hypothetical protein